MDLPLLISADPALVAELEQTAAAASTELEHRTEPPVRNRWMAAPLVVLDAAAVAEIAATRLPRRPGVVVVGPDEPGPGLLQVCLRAGVERVVRLDEAGEQLVGMLADATTGGPGNGRLITVIGACGGAGASVLAAALAATADTRGRRVLLADCDPWGPGLDVVLGVEDKGVHWRSLAAPTGRLSAADLHAALPRLAVGAGRISLLCPDRRLPEPVDPDVAEVVINSGRRAGDLMVADLARTIDEAAGRLLAMADLTLLVVPSDVRGSFAAVRMTHRLAELGVHPELVVRGPSPGGIGADDISAAVGLPVLVRMRPQPGIAQTLETGRVPGLDRRGPLATAAGRALDRLDEAA